MIKYTTLANKGQAILREGGTRVTHSGTVRAMMPNNLAIGGSTALCLF